ncbi:MAG TPA: class II fumarate hydratase [Acidimicrobiales bacterium]|nr:class II fumarate hydratase [Acidimicrobiales bacterium]
MTDPAGDVRIEHDSMGEVRVPAWARWGAQTQRAVENFPVSGLRLSRELIGALGRIKAAAAVANGRLGVLDADMSGAIADAAAQVAAGGWDDHFPVDVFQTGSGTSSNMNANEVVANLATERLGRGVHPNDHVNASQSSNDVFPSAIHLAATQGVVERLVPALRHLAEVVGAKGHELAGVVKAGRTHLMDATPVTLGQELGGYRTAVERGAERLEGCLPRLGELALGGTAVGTGLNAPPEFAGLVVEHLVAETGLPLSEAADHFEAQGGRDALVEASGAMRTVAVTLQRVANDLRLMASGPRAGLAEIRLPDLQPGSSIMPGKVNPVIPEAALQVVAHVVGNDATVAWAGAVGAFELSNAMPVMGHNLLEAVRLLASAARLLADRCVAGIEADVEQCRAYAESSPALATALNPHIGYERAAEVARTALAEGKTLRQVVVEQGLLSAEEADRVLDVDAMTRGGVVG